MSRDISFLRKEVNCRYIGVCSCRICSPSLSATTRMLSHHRCMTWSCMLGALTNLPQRTGFVPQCDTILLICLIQHQIHRRLIFESAVVPFVDFDSKHEEVPQERVFLLGHPRNSNYWDCLRKDNKAHRRIRCCADPNSLTCSVTKTASTTYKQKKVLEISGITSSRIRYHNEIMILDNQGSCSKLEVLWIPSLILSNVDWRNRAWIHWEAVLELSKTAHAGRIEVFIVCQTASLLCRTETGFLHDLVQLSYPVEEDR